MSKRGPTRTPQERIEDIFADASIPEQERMLAAFGALHRMKRRMVDVIPNLADTWDGKKRSQGSLIDEPATETSIKLKKSGNLPIE